MSRNSKLYGDLKRRIDYLSAQYLPAPNPAGNYTKKQQDAIRTFLLLSHAELEYYFEESSRVIAKRALDRWLADHNYKSRVLLYLATFLDHTERIKQAETSEDKIKNIVGYYFVQIKDNNGIKRDNILKLLCPLGVDQDQIDNSCKHPKKYDYSLVLVECNFAPANTTFICLHENKSKRSRPKAVRKVSLSRES